MTRLSAALVLAILAGPASAQQIQCGHADLVRAALATGFQEARRFAGLSRAAIIELWHSESGSWTVLVIRSDGVACILATGEAGGFIAAPPPGTPG